MHELTKRQKEIMRILGRMDVITSDGLGNLLHVSGKTIRNEIKEINLIFDEPCILTAKGSGFYLNPSQDVSLLLQEEETDVEVKLDRNFDILKELLSSEQVQVFELADRLYISESTLNKSIQELNDIIAKRNADIQIKRENNYLMLNGNEEARRQVSTYFLMHEIDEYDFDLNNYAHFFEAFDLDEVKDYVLCFNREHDVKMKDFETISFVMHTAIMLERVIQGNEILTVEPAMTNKECDQLAQEFYEGLQQIVKIELSAPELRYLSCLFAGKLPVIGSEELEEMRRFAEELLEQIQIHYEVDFTQDTVFKNNFLIHLMGLKNRIQSNTFLNNPLITDIKKHFPIMYDISVFITMKVQEKFNTHLYEDEIGYITLHLMGSLERLHKSSCRRIVILSPMGEAGNAYLRSKLSNIHDLTIELCEILSIFDTAKIEKYKPDLIISFLKVPKGVSYPVYVCDTLLSDLDLERIYRLLKQHDQVEHIESFFTKDLFFVNQQFSTKEEVISFLCDQLYQQGYAPRDYVDYVLKREETAPTAYGNLFAIPHPIEKKANRNMIAVCALKKAISWNDQKVKLVFLFSLSKKRSEAFDKLFEQLVSLLDDENKVKQLLKIDEYDPFLSAFLEGRAH